MGIRCSEVLPPRPEMKIPREEGFEVAVEWTQWEGEVSKSMSTKQLRFLKTTNRFVHDGKDEMEAYSVCGSYDIQGNVDIQVAYKDYKQRGHYTGKLEKNRIVGALSKEETMKDSFEVKLKTLIYLQGDDVLLLRDWNELVGLVRIDSRWGTCDGVYLDSQYANFNIRFANGIPGRTHVQIGEPNLDCIFTRSDGQNKEIFFEFQPQPEPKLQPQPEPKLQPQPEPKLQPQPPPAA